MVIVTFPLSRKTAVFYLTKLTIRNHFKVQLFSLSSLSALKGIQRNREGKVLLPRNCVYISKTTDKRDSK